MTYQSYDNIDITLMKKLIDFPDVVLNRVNEIRDREGHKTFTAALFSTVAQYYDRKYYSKYKEKVGTMTYLEPELTPEQQCELKGGSVRKSEGNVMCVFRINASATRSVPIARTDLY